jgi:phosphate starvation-inducible protein PhoH
MRKHKTLQSENLVLQEIVAKNYKQEVVLDSTGHLLLYGVAGTGKTFLSMYKGFKEMEAKTKQRLVVIRSAVSTRDIGYLPGNTNEKVSVYEEPYRDICQELFSRGDAYEIMKTKQLIHFMPTSFVRGITLRDAFIVVDECQNMTLHELDSIITRTGENCTIVFCGDFRQADLLKNGMEDFVKILHHMGIFSYVDFEVDDIVRSEFVKQYITSRLALNL